MSNTTRRAQRSGVLQTGFAILQVFQDHPGEMLRLTDIASLLGIPRSTAHRYTQTLIGLGQLEQPEGTHKYRLVQSLDMAEGQGRR